jgi:nucleoid DNA-binding protein
MSRNAKSESSQNWFGYVLEKFIPSDSDLEGKSPKELIKHASWKAYWISFAASLAPGPFGYATIIPELIAVTKVQINLIHAIAKFYGKAQILNGTLIALVFANQCGLQLGKTFVRKSATKYFVRALGRKAMRPIVQKIASTIGVRITQRLAGRWVIGGSSFIFGYFSKKMTEKIGEEAIKLFEREIEISSAKKEIEISPAKEELNLRGKKFKLPKKDYDAIIEKVKDLAKSEWNNEGQVLVPGIGKLRWVKRKSRMGRNPATGETVKIPAKIGVKGINRISSLPINSRAEYQEWLEHA